MSWSSRVIDELCELKAAGVGFDQAWRLALRAHPPSARDEGYRETLFPEDAEELSAVEWLQWAAGDAWFGRRPVLSHLGTALRFADGADGSRPVMRSRRARSRAGARGVL